MRTRDLSPAMIGKRVRVQADGLDVTGVLQDLGVTTEEERTFEGFRTSSVHVAGVHVALDGHELKLTGDETCSIVGTPPGGRA